MVLAPTLLSRATSASSKFTVELTYLEAPAVGVVGVGVAGVGLSKSGKSKVKIQVSLCRGEVGDRETARRPMGLRCIFGFAESFLLIPMSHLSCCMADELLMMVSAK